MPNNTGININSLFIINFVMYHRPFDTGLISKHFKPPISFSPFAEQKKIKRAGSIAACPLRLLKFADLAVSVYCQ